MLRCVGRLQGLACAHRGLAGQLSAFSTKTLEPEGEFAQAATAPYQATQSTGGGSQNETGESVQSEDHKNNPRSKHPNPKIQELLRVGHASEVTPISSLQLFGKRRISHSKVGAVAFFRGQSWATGGRVDVEYFLDQERQQLESVESLAMENRSRPSAILPALELGGWALGVATAWAPRQVSLAVAGAVQDCLAEQFNDQLRELRQQGELDQVKGLRESLRNLRDTSRAPDGAPTPPDLSKITKIQDLTPESALGAAVQISCKVAMGLAKKI